MLNNALSVQKEWSLIEHIVIMLRAVDTKLKIRGSKNRYLLEVFMYDSIYIIKKKTWTIPSSTSS